MVARGVHTILYAFFDLQGQLDREAMRQQVEACLETGVAEIAVLGLATRNENRWSRGRAGTALDPLYRFS